MTATTRSPWTTNCSPPRSRRWRVNALWPTGGRDDEPDTLALLGSLLWHGARQPDVEDLARQRLSLPQGDAAEHDRRSPWSGRRMLGRGTGRAYPPAHSRLPPSRRGLPQVMGAVAAILKVAHFLDSQISGEMIHRWDGAFAIPSGWFARGLRDFSGPPEGAERQYRDGGFRSGGLRPVFHAKRVVSVVPAHP